MLKAWFGSFLVLVLLVLAAYAGLFDWLAGVTAKLVGAGLVCLTLGAAFFILGNPFKK